MKYVLIAALLLPMLESVSPRLSTIPLVLKKLAWFASRYFRTAGPKKE